MKTSQQIILSLTSPFSGRPVQYDATGIEQATLDSYAVHMNDDLRERICSDHAPCSPAEFLAAWAEAVGPVEAGRVILGS